MLKTDLYGSLMMSALFTACVILSTFVLTGNWGAAFYLGGAAFIALFAVQNAVYIIGRRIEKLMQRDEGPEIDFVRHVARLAINGTNNDVAMNSLIVKARKLSGTTP